MYADPEPRNFFDSARFGCLRGTARLLDRLAAELRGHHVLELGLLLGGEREKLVGRLTDLKRAFRTLAAGDYFGERLGVALDVFDHLRLDSHRMAKRAHACIEPRAGVANAGISPQCRAEVMRKQRLKLVVELVDPKIDGLRAAH